MRCIAVSFVGHYSEERRRAAGADLVVANLTAVHATTVKELIGTSTREERA